MLDPLKRIAVNNLSKLLYDFLPASGNQNTSFPVAAEKVGLGQYWIHNSKQAAIADFLEKVITYKSNALIPFLDEVLVQSLQWRENRGNPLTREEVGSLNLATESLGYRSNFLTSSQLLDTLPKAVSGAATAKHKLVSESEPGPGALEALSTRFIQITKLRVRTYKHA